jgi:uncharacterized protein
MRWQMGRRSGNVERNGRPGGIGGLPVKGGLGSVLAIAAIVYLMGGDPTAILLNGMSAQAPYLSPQQEQEQSDFVAAVLGNTEDVWHARFREQNRDYVEPKLVLFDGAVNSGCGFARAATGPFYCPGDARVYLDLAFFQSLQDSLDAPGDFARAYVIAHEIGHHVQALLGTEKRVRAAMTRAGGKEANALSVKLELQADCYAGLWAHDTDATYKMLEAGDLDEAMNAASQIGDDRLQTQAQGYAVPDSFTHGSSAARREWFHKGYESGDMAACDTFAAEIP